MKAVRGSVAQSKRIQLAKAASSFARFAAAADGGCGEQYANAAYLRLASTAFDELVRMEANVGVGEKAKKNKGKRGSAEVGDGDAMETGDQVVESNVKRLKI